MFTVTPPNSAILSKHHSAGDRMVKPVTWLLLCVCLATFGALTSPWTAFTPAPHSALGVAFAASNPGLKPHPVLPLQGGTPVAPATTPPLLTENFVSNVNGWNIAAQQPDTGQFGTFAERIGNGTFHIEANTTKGVFNAYWPNIPAVSDFTVTVLARQISGPTSAAYALIFRRDTNGNKYIFEISNDQKFTVYLLDQGQWTTLIDTTPSNAIVANGVNQLTVIGEGSHFAFLINGTQVGAIDNSQLASGQVGVGFDMDGGQQAVFEFLNFQVWGPSAIGVLVPTQKSPVPAPLPGPSSCSLVFTDNFTSAVNDWGIPAQQPNTDQWGTFTERIGNGTFHIEANTTKGVFYSFWPKASASDLNLSVDAQMVSGGPSSSAYGLIFRRDSNGNKYIFEVRNDKQFAVYLLNGGQWTTLIDTTPSNAIVPNGVNHLNVVAQGAHFTFSINNQQVGAIDNTQLTTGQVGVGLDMDSGTQAVFEFSNFVLCSPSGNVPSNNIAPAPPAVNLPSNWPLVLLDHFASNSNGWNISDTQPNSDSRGTYVERIGNGTFHLEVNATQSVFVSHWPNLAAVGDLNVSVDVNMISGQTSAVSYGLIFRRDENSNKYVFDVSNSRQFAVWLFNQGQWTTLIDWTSTNAIQPNGVNHLNVVAQGSHFIFSINNQQVGTIDNPQLASGKVGVGLDVESGQAVVEFSNFEVRVPQP